MSWLLIPTLDGGAAVAVTVAAGTDDDDGDDDVATTSFGDINGTCVLWGGRHFCLLV